MRITIKRIKTGILRRIPLFRKIGFNVNGSLNYLEKPLFIRGKKYISLGSRITILKNYRIECFDEYEDQHLKPMLIIGDRTNIGYNFQCLVTTKCTIGNDVLIASNVFISTENHGINPFDRHVKQNLVSKPVTIGNNCWIGEKAIILPGVNIGNNCVVGAGSVVTKDIKDNSIAVGNPARVIKIYDENKQDWINVR